MRLLLTRAAADAERTKVALEDAGHIVSLAPVIEMVSSGARWPAGVVDRVVASSAWAFSLLAEGPAPEAARLMPLVVIGRRTAVAARERGFTGPIDVLGTSGELKAFVDGRSATPVRSLYLAGRDRKLEIERAHAEAGARLSVVEVYEAKAAGALADDVLRAIATDALDGVLHFSRRSALLFCRLARSEDLSRLEHFALSDDVAEPLRDQGCGRLHVAGTPDEAALLSLVGLRPAP